MKYTVIKKFKDKKTGEIYKPGATIDLSGERAKEVLGVGKFIEKAGVKTPEEATQKTQKKTTK